MTIQAGADARPNLDDYDQILVAFSGGKDSLACLLHLLELGAPRAKIELHHHEVDGAVPVMDWPVTPAYCRAVAADLDLPIYFSGKLGGFLAELRRQDRPTMPIWFDDPERGTQNQVGGTGPNGTRGQFPQVSADLRVRWCSAYLKIDVFAAMIRNSDRFIGRRTLVVTGERAEESKARSHYASLEPHRADTRTGKRRRRHIDHWRPVHAWAERDVWEIIQRHGIVPHPAYQLGWGRLSCRSCIFGSPNQWASLQHLYPRSFETVEALERSTGKTIHRTRSITEQAQRGAIYDAAVSAPRELVALGDSKRWNGPIRIDPAAWQTPAGAYGESAGPI